MSVFKAVFKTPFTNLILSSLHGKHGRHAFLPCSQSVVLFNSDQHFEHESWHTLFILQTSEKEMIRKELSKDDHSQVADASEDVIYKIDIPANRYDMLCLEGIARALNIFKGRVQPPKYKLADMSGKTPCTAELQDSATFSCHWCPWLYPTFSSSSSSSEAAAELKHTVVFLVSFSVSKQQGSRLCHNLGSSIRKSASLQYMSCSRQSMPDLHQYEVKSSSDSSVDC